MNGAAKLLRFAQPFWYDRYFHKAAGEVQAFHFKML